MPDSKPTQRPDNGGFGELLRTRRLHAGLSQERLAGRSGLSPRAIRKIESGRSAPRASTLNLLADALGLSSDDRTTFFAAALPGNSTLDDGAAEPPISRAPAQLPAVTSLFHGRRAELERLLDLAKPGRVVTVHGMAGIGKSSLAVHAARSMAADYPDGQLFLDLCGFSTTQPPVNPADALDRLLRALDVSGERIPAHLDDRATLFRSTLAGRRILLLLDNAADADQLRPLLPGDSPATVLATSRNTLAGIHDADHVGLKPLDVDAAVSLLAEATGIPELIDADRAALIDVVELCGRLPLAIRIAAAKLRSRPQWSTADLVQRMRRPHYVLTAGEDSLGAAFDATYRGLTEAHRRLFRLSGTIPVTHFDTFTAAALVNAAPAEVEDDLESLVDAHLLETNGPGRYHFHDLLREYAARTARHSDDEPTRTAALDRVLALFRTTAAAAAQQLAPHYFGTVSNPADPAAFATVDIDDQHDAVAWFSTEIHNALALISDAEDRGMDRAANDLAMMVRPFLLFHAHHDEMLRLARRGVAWALRLDDHEAEAHWLLAEGDVLRKGDRTGEAKIPQQRALRLFEESGNLVAQATVLNAMGLTDQYQGDFESALRRYDRAIVLTQRIGNQVKEGVVRNNRASSSLLLGRVDEATEQLRASMAIFQGLEYARELVRTRLYLGDVLRTHGNAEEALELHQLTAQYTQEHQELEGLGFACNAMAHDCLELGRIEAARSHCERAWQITLDHHLEGLRVELLRTWGAIHLAAGALDAAEQAFTEFLSHAENSGSHHDRAMALHGIADVLAARGDEAESVRLYTEALELYESLGVAEAEVLRRQLR